MDEFNLASRFGREEDERPMPSRGKLKRRFRPGVGMEKPTEVMEPEDEAPLRRDGLEALEGEELEDMGEMEEDEAFMDLVSRMAGGSASEKRARERRRNKRRPGNDSLRAEFADRENEE